MEIPAPSRAFTKAPPLRGTITVPGDKSISHRALMLSALAVGESRVEGLLEGADVTATAEALRALGADFHRDPQGARLLDGVGVGEIGSATGMERVWQYE